VISYALRIVSLLCIAALVASFAAFASDEAGEGSKKTVARLAGASPDEVARQQGTVNIDAASPSPRVERIREQRHGAMRERLDDVNDELTAPFAGLVGADSVWAQRIVSGLLALAVFGVGIGFLSRVAAARGV
jgi:hypothetical protein